LAEELMMLLERTPAPTLALYASTGRTGSTFLCHLFQQSPIAAVFHAGLGARIGKGVDSADEMLAAYLTRITDGVGGRSVYVEGNPRFFERVAKLYGIGDPCQIVQLLQARGTSVRCLFMTRHPRGYALSIKNRWRERGRDYWPGPTGVEPATFQRMYGCPREWLRAEDYFGHICASWLLRNRFLKRLMELPECHFVRFEDVFDRSVSDFDFVRRIQRIHEHFQLPGLTRIDELLLERHRPRNATTHVEGLTDDEVKKLRRMCSVDAAEWGYTI
jgi:hypothetical protein